VAHEGQQDFLSRLVRLRTSASSSSTSPTPPGERSRDRLDRAAAGKLRVDRVNRSQRKRRPAPPFITSTLQQDAARKLRFSAQRTMRTAQPCTRAWKVNGVSQGLITYMRTDSVHLSDDALADLRAHIKDDYGENYLPGKPNVYKTKSKNAQEAHEAIRPTSAALKPEQLKSKLSEDQYRLYDLIWRRALASQMKPALVDTVAVEFDCDGDATFRANGSVIAFPGFLRPTRSRSRRARRRRRRTCPT
jgi:DNA topoisomerase I